MSENRGFVIVALTRPKAPANVGTAMRAAANFGAEGLLLEGVRFPVTHLPTDVDKMWRHTPVTMVEDAIDSAPVGVVPVAIEITEGARPLPTFCHPERAMYIFGPEDGSIRVSTLERCPLTISIPSLRCLNLGTCVAVVLYDRMAKAQV